MLMLSELSSPYTLQFSGIVGTLTWAQAIVKETRPDFLAVPN